MFPHHSKDKKSGSHIPACGFIEKPIAGLVGTIGNVINSIDGHNTPVPSKNGTSSGTSSGTEATASWDDGKHAKVKKVQITFDDVIHSIQVTYDGSLQSHRRGSVGPKSAEFTLGSDEYITALSAYGKTLNSQDVITSLTFSTNKKTYGPYGKKSGFQISAPEATGQQIAGFLGTSGNVLNSIDVHYASVPTTTPPVLPKKLKAVGGETGAVWDDGHHDNVKKVYVGQNQDGVGAVKFEYVNGSEVVFGDEHGKPTLLGYEEFELESDEYITSVEGTYDQIFGSDGAIVTMLLFKTSKNKTYGPYGLEGSSKLTLKEEGSKVVGFHGLAGESINAIGVYVAPLGIIPLTPATRIKKLEGYGGVGGTPWDDGAFDGIRKVFVGKSNDGIAYVKFEYVNGSEVVVGDEHGKETSFGVEEFEVDEDDSIVYVEGYRAQVGNDQIIAALIFKTYKGKSSKQFGTIVPGTKFVLQGGRIVGFHGHSTDVLVSLGAYILTSSTPNIVGKWIKVDQAGEAPGLRCSHAVAQIGNKIYSFGGELIPNQPIDKDLYVFDLENGTWSISPATGDVPHLACLGVCMVSVGSTLYVFGGRDTSRQYNGFYSFDTTKNEWKLLTPVEEGPTPRSFHSMAADDNHVYVFGGVSATTRVKTLDAYNIAEQKWVQCSSPGDSFNIRGGAGLQVVEGKVWVIYGFTGYELDDVHYYDPVQDEWTHVETFGEKPAGRSVFSSAVVGRHILIFGGELDMDPQAHVGPGQLTGGTFALDTETLVWERVDKLGEEEETPEIRGWAASTTGIFDGKKGLVMHGGKAQTNDRFKDLYFYKVGNA